MVVVDHGKITYSGPTISSSIPANAKVFVESGKTLLPGLIGMHEHLFYIAAGAGAGHLLLGAEQAESAPRLYLAAGITTARTTGSIEPVTDLAIKRAIEQGTQAGPDLDVTGPYLDGRPNAILQNQSLTGPADARETVDYWSERGATSFPADRDISPEELKAAIDEVHALKLKLRQATCVQSGLQKRSIWGSTIWSMGYRQIRSLIHARRRAFARQQTRKPRSPY